MIKITCQMIVYGCGHHMFTEMIVGKLDQSINHRSNTRCLQCFNTKSLPPSPQLMNSHGSRD